MKENDSFKSMSNQSTDCIFCGIVAKKVPANIVYEDEELIAFLDIRPINPGHSLVIPRAHAANLKDLAPPLAGRLFQVQEKSLQHSANLDFDVKVLMSGWLMEKPPFKKYHIYTFMLFHDSKGMAYEFKWVLIMEKHLQQRS